MSKIQIQLNGQQGLAPKHFGNSLYSTNDPHLKYIGESGQMASGIWSSDRYNGFMSPIPDKYQEGVLIEIDTLTQDSPIQMAYTDREDPTSKIVLADANGIYNVKESVDIGGAVGVVGLGGSYSSPVYERVNNSLLATKISAGDSRNNSIVSIDSTHFAVAGRTSTGSGIVRIFKIEDNNDINLVNSLEHDALGGSDNSLGLLDSKHLVLAYLGTDNDGYVKTFSLDDSYNITEEDVVEHDVIFGVSNSLVVIDPTHFILAYAGDSLDGYIKTFSVDASYNISLINSLEHDIVQGTENSLIMIDSTHFMLAYSNNTQGVIKTFSIDGSYVITQISSVTHSGSAALYNSLTMIDSTHFALAYTSGVTGIVKTFSIDGGYVITQLNSLTHELSRNVYNSISLIDTTHLMLAYEGVESDGYVKTFSLDGAYNITEIDSFEHDTTEGKFNSLIKKNSNIFILAYTSNIDLGYLKTFSVDGSYNIIRPTERSAVDIHDVTRSQYAGAISYYYTWGSKIGRCDSLSNIGKDEEDSVNSIRWIGLASNPSGLSNLRSKNPTLANGNNQYIYVIDGSAIHGINISLSGIEEDVDGTFDSDLIIFQSGVQLIDAVENAGVMYISMSDNGSDVDLWNLPSTDSTATRNSVYIWNKISEQQLQANEMPLTNCKHVGRIWVMDGTVYVMTINSANISEIRAMSGGQMKVIHELGGDNEFNIGKQSITVTDIGTIIATNKGNLYLLNKDNKLIKIGVYANDVDKRYASLVIYGGDDGHEPSNLTQGLESVVPNLSIFYTDTNGDAKIKKFFLRNIGTMTNAYKDQTYTTEQQEWLDTNVPAIELKANQGDVYSLVTYLPKLSKLNNIYLPCVPTTGTATTEIAKVKVYLNNSQVPDLIHSVTQKAANKGYIHLEINKPNVNAIQFEIEYSIEQILGENDFSTSFALVDYTPTRTSR